jgi:hypothetical protein
MNKPSEAVTKRMREDLEKAYMEIIPVSGIEEKLGALQPNMHVAVTCSPTKGIDATMKLSEKLMMQGFKVIPHIAAKCVSGEKHLEAIVKKLDELGVESIFVPGGDRLEPIGEFNDAYDLLKALNSPMGSSRSPPGTKMLSTPNSSSFLTIASRCFSPLTHFAAICGITLKPCIISFSLSFIVASIPFVGEHVTATCIFG